jgi:predicted lipoprotein with Yx(FWY)xxD motif
MRSKATALGLLFAIAGIAGCGGGGSSASPADAAPTTAAAVPKGPPIEVRKTDFGRILVGAHGRALYLFTADDRASNCSGACARAWPPYIVKRRPVGKSGARGELTGTVRRGDGRLQATYAGRPLYYYVGDNEPGEVLCQDVEEFGGHWYVVRASGKPVL